MMGKPTTFETDFKSPVKWFTPILPYLAVGLGMFWFQNAWAALLGFHIALLLAIGLAGSGPPVRVFFKSSHIRWVILTILLSGSLGIFLYVFWSAFGIANDVSTHVAALGLDPSSWIAFIVYFSLVNPLLEEYYWRGVLGSSTKRPYISDFLYAGFHALILIGSMPVASIVASLTVLVLGAWFWRQVAREDGGLLAPVLGHMTADFAILVVIYQMSL